MFLRLSVGISLKCERTLLIHTLACYFVNSGLPVGVSLDRKELIDTLPPLPAGSRLQFEAGDFFEPLPESVHGADVVLMKFIM
eukprot:1137955-Pelagomonas_calceolata.AAC.3